MNRLILYTTDGCHLCELAWKICINLNITQNVSMVEIIDDVELVKEYGYSIPVLKRTDNQCQLFWPFSENDVAELIK